MLSKSSKIISAAVTVLALGTVGVTAAVASNSINTAGPVQTSSSVVSFSSVTDSSIISASSTILSVSSAESIESKASSATSSKGKANVVASESKTSSTAKSSNPVATPQSNTSSTNKVIRNQDPPKYPVIDPATGLLVWPNYSNYETVKAELGGDAGTVDPDHSTACQKAKEEARQKYLASQAASSKVQKPAVPGQGDPNK